MTTEQPSLASGLRDRELRSLDRALCEFTNHFEDFSLEAADEPTKRNFKDLCDAYNAAHEAGVFGKQAEGLRSSSSPAGEKVEPYSGPPCNLETLASTAARFRRQEAPLKAEGNPHGLFYGACALGIERAVEEIRHYRAGTTTPQSDKALKEVLEWIDYHAENQDMNHVDFRVDATLKARAALQNEKEKG